MPMRYVAGRTVAVNHAHACGARVGELVINSGGNVDGLACFDRCSFGAQAHFALAFENQVNLFLLLIVPRHLAAMGLQCDAPHREALGLDGAGSPHQILRSAACRVSTSGNFRKVSYDHCAFSPVRDKGAVSPRNTSAVTMEPISAPTSTVKAIQRTICGRNATTMYLPKKDVGPE